LADTRRALSAAGIAHAGAGPDLAAAVAPSVVEVGDLRVAVLALTDRSPAYGAGEDVPGTAYAALRRRDPRTRRLVRTALSRARAAAPDLVVASLHWGPNWEVRPSEGQRAFARWLVDRGVDVVHGHSAHVIQGVEAYRGRPILYDCGDFVDDYLFREDVHNKRSFLFVLRVEDGVPASLELVPTQIYDEAVHPADDAVAAWLRGRMRTLSGELGTTVERGGRGLVVDLDADPNPDSDPDGDPGPSAPPSQGT
jgi:poly-gamma-glutamate synthesis protein (capsule biosynthesis protein)